MPIRTQTAHDLPDCRQLEPGSANVFSALSLALSPELGENDILQFQEIVSRYRLPGSNGDIHSPVHG